MSWSGTTHMSTCSACTQDCNHGVTYIFGWGLQHIFSWGPEYLKVPSGVRVPVCLNAVTIECET